MLVTILLRNGLTDFYEILYAYSESLIIGYYLSFVSLTCNGSRQYCALGCSGASRLIIIARRWTVGGKLGKSENVGKRHLSDCYQLRYAAAVYSTGAICYPKFRSENISISRIPIIPTDVPIQFKRIQFPIRLAFAMTINKFQGQTTSVCGLDLSTPCFSHRQLYKACSRVGKPSSLFELTKDGLTKNIVHAITLKN
ncbi:uncharacterized protein LOC113560566 [Rhopalosiphum maidis]|uniref:uncharacterized protein LOC113560566 n=1 Tax=Rhopalosiphum maidis TaxID=43146 RepID=UPI000EFEC8A7|nr:uncharacterized protein LOC113560566 [Rhopalosiphum maidis]